MPFFLKNQYSFIGESSCIKTVIIGSFDPQYEYYIVLAMFTQSIKI